MNTCNRNVLHEDFKQFVNQVYEDEELRKYPEVFTENLLWNFFVGKKCDKENAFKIIKDYIFHRVKKYPDIVTGSQHVPARLYRDGHFRLLKHKDQKGRHILLVRSVLWIPNAENPAGDWIREFLNFMDTFLRSDDSVPFDTGIVIIFDPRGYGLQHMTPWTPFKITKGVNLMRDYPIRFKAFHLLNGGITMTLAINLALRFFPEKIAKRVTTHHDLESLHSVMDKNILPECIGGIVPESEAFANNFQDNIQATAHFYKQWRKRMEEN